MKQFKEMAERFHMCVQIYEDNPSNRKFLLENSAFDIYIHENKETNTCYVGFYMKYTCGTEWYWEVTREQAVELVEKLCAYASQILAFLKETGAKLSCLPCD